MSVCNKAIVCGIVVASRSPLLSPSSTDRTFQATFKEHRAEIAVDIPPQLLQRNLVIEASCGGIDRSVTRFSNSLQVQVSEKEGAGESER